MKGKIIVVDRDTVFAEKLAKKLEIEQFNVFSLNAGKQVLELLQTVGIHVVVCGHNLPDMSSLALLKAVKKENPKTEVILMIEPPTVELLEGAIKGGACDCIRLPVEDWDRFRQTVSEAFQKSQLAFTNKQLIEDLLQKNQELIEAHNMISAIHQDTEALYYFGRGLSTSLNLEEIYAMTTNATYKLLNNRPTLFLLFDEKSLQLYLKKSVGFHSPPADFTIPVDIKNHDRLVNWVQEEAYVDYLRAGFSKIFQFNSILSKPILIHNRFYGLLAVFENGDSDFSERDNNLFNQFVSQSAFVLENALLHEKTNELANRDDLTGAFNRRYFQEKIEEEIKRASRLNIPFALLILDIDYFKHYNDTYGHVKGDSLLRELVVVINERLRSTDTVSRFGGDEFVILLMDTDKYSALEIGNHIRQVIELDPRFRLEYGYEKKITISIGIAQFPDDGTSSIELIRKADQALYVAKARGRNQVAS